MTFIIDGHNLIPRMPGMDLSDVDDEEKLIRSLQDYCRLRRTSVEVYFDQAPAGFAGERRVGQVRAHFVRTGRTADEMIMSRLNQLGKRAKNVRVVSSDRQVQAAARAAHAGVISSEEFAVEWEKLIQSEPESDPRNRMLSESEIKAWEWIFRRGHPPSEED